MKLKTLFAFFLLTAATSFAFLPSLQNGFIQIDDPVMLTENQDVLNPSVINALRLFITPREGLLNPIVTVSYILERSLWGTGPFIFHLTNLFLHVITVFLIFSLFKALGLPFGGALAGTLIFAVHPVNTEAVAWISSRKDLLCGFFCLLSVLAYLKHLNTGKRHGYCMSLLFFLCALYSKPSAASLPAILLAEYYKTGSVKIRNKAIFFALAAGFLIFNAFVRYAPGFSDGFFRFGPLKQAAYALYGAVAGIAKFIYPSDLSFIAPYGPGELPIFHGALAVTGAFLTAGIIAAFMRNNIKPLNFGILFYIFAFLPSSQILSFGTGLHAEKYLYLPFAGLAYIAGWACNAIAERSGRAGKNMLIIVFAVLIFYFSCLTYDRCHFWKNGTMLLNDAVLKTDNPVAYCMRGDIMFSKGDERSAVSDYKSAVQKNPQYVPAYMRLAGYSMNKGNFENAAGNYTQALNHQKNNVKALTNRGLSYEKLGKPELALKYYCSALEINPDEYDALNNRAVLYAKLGEYSKALNDLEKAIAASPSRTEAFSNKANLENLQSAYKRKREVEGTTRKL